MKIHERPIEYFISLLKEGQPFSLPGFGDAEWFCMMKNKSRMGHRTGFGMLMTPETGEFLKEAVAYKDKWYMRAMPKMMFKITDPKGLKEFIAEHNIYGDFYERDMILDDLAEKAGLNPLINQLREMDVYIVSQSALRNLTFLNYKGFHEISTPDFHLDLLGMKKIVDDILKGNKKGVYLFSGGMSSSIMISQLHGKIKDSWFIDCGSIWDAFCGIGGQREWREKLYEDKIKLKHWIDTNLYGIPRK